MPVDTQHEDYKKSIRVWQRCRDCFAGSDAVKSRGALYLPLLDSHTEDVMLYEAYKTRALFFNATRRTVQGLSGAVFQRAPTAKSPDAIKDQLENVTLTGKNLETFGLSVLKEVIVTGRVGILIDMPEKMEEGSRPYWVQYSPESIVNWQTHTFNGKPTLTRVVLEERYYVDKANDPFESDEKIQYRVLELTNLGEFRTYQQTIWRKGENDKWIPGATFTPTRNSNPLDFIPFIFVGPTTIQPAIEESPILDLVDVNLSHYRTSADLEHGLHWTACPTPWAAGITLLAGEKLKIGAGEAWVFPDANGRAGMVEFTGQGLGSLAMADEKKRKMMSALGARLLEDSISSESTLGIKMRASGEHASLRTIVQQLERAITWCVKVHAWWASGEKEVDKVDALVQLNKDFIVGRLPPAEITALISLLQAEAISYETFYEKLTEGEMTREGIGHEEELKLIDAAGGRWSIKVEPDPGKPKSEPKATKK